MLHTSNHLLVSYNMPCAFFNACLDGSKHFFEKAFAGFKRCFIISYLLHYAMCLFTNLFKCLFTFFEFFQTFVLIFNTPATTYSIPRP